MIAEATAQRGTMTTASTVKVLKVMRDSAQRKMDIYNTWQANAGDVQREFNGNFSAYVGHRVALANEQQNAMAAGAGESDSPDSGAPAAGSTNSGCLLNGHQKAGGGVT
jgi:hypothetical protein